MTIQREQSYGEKILIVEDEPDILKMTEFRIKKGGYETVVALDGETALEKAQSERPDMIVLDYKLPGIDGVEVYKRLKGDDELKEIPVLFLSASRGNVDFLDKMEEIGAEYSMIKPYEPLELMALIKKIVGE
ncbi:MAG: response regulator [Candidatus Tantalella remota]|nr:response regulator [Candidatus Tantalella remota]